MLEQLTKLRETVAYTYEFIIKFFMIKDLDGQPNEEMHRTR